MILVRERTHLVTKELVIQVLSVRVSGEFAPNANDSEGDFSGHFWL